MAKHLIQKILPNKDKLVKGGTLRFFSQVLKTADIWHLNRRSACRATLIGLFCAFIPVPAQMFIAAFFCIYARANLPLSLLCVWTTNPLTIAPIFYATYKLGAFILEIPPTELHYQMSWQWMNTQFSIIWKPLFLGSLIAGSFFSAIGYTSIDLIWRWKTLQKWNSRRNKNKPSSS